MTESTPPIIERGRFRSGSRSSSVKYSALCQPPYVITTDCSAMTTPASVTGGTPPVNVPAPIAAGTRRDSTKQATTSTRNATNLIAVVIS